MRLERNQVLPQIIFLNCRLSTFSPSTKAISNNCGSSARGYPWNLSICISVAHNTKAAESAGWCTQCISMSSEPDWRNCGCACVNWLVLCRSWEPNPTRGPRNANSTPGLLLRSSHRLWELPDGRQDDNRPAEVPRARTVRTSHPAHLPCCSTSFASPGTAWVTARLSLVTAGSPAAPGPCACLRKFFFPTEAETASQGPYMKHISSPPLFTSSKNSHSFYQHTFDVRKS